MINGKPKILFCTVYYNQWYMDPETHHIKRNWEYPMPIEESFDELARISYQKHEYFHPGILYEMEDFYFEWRRVRATYIDEGRNSCINLNLSQTESQELPEDFDYYWTIDADHEFTYWHIKKLLSHKLPVVSGAYIERANPKLNYCAGKLNKEQKGVISEWLTQDKKGLHKVDFHGLGFCKIARDVFHKTKYRWFDTELVTYINKEGQRASYKIQEDVFFCLRLKDAGLQTYVDCDCVVPHHIDQTVIGVVSMKKHIKGKSIVKTNKLAGKNNQPQSISIDEVDSVQLKALAYDLISEIERNQGVLRQINDVLAKRAKQEQQIADANKAPEAAATKEPTPPPTADATSD